MGADSVTVVDDGTTGTPSPATTAGCNAGANSALAGTVDMFLYRLRRGQVCSAETGPRRLYTRFIETSNGPSRDRPKESVFHMVSNKRNT